MDQINLPQLDLPRVVIIGGGFAGLKLANALNPKLAQIVLLDQQNYHTFQPLLYQVATAGLEPDSITYPLRKILKNKPHTHIRMAEVQQIDLAAKLVMTDIGSLAYDHLVIATGAKTNYFGNAHIEKYAMPMKNLTESLDLRSVILQNFEAALNENDIAQRDALMNFVIVGGGPTGVELAGALAELRGHVLPKDYPDLDLRRMQINLVEAGPKLLPAMGQHSSDSALKYLKQMEVNVWTNTLVKDYDGVHIDTSTETFEAHTMIWSAGVTGNIPNGIPASSIERGRIIVDEYGYVNGYKDVLAIGDVALMKTKDAPGGLPMLGSVAQQQGAYMAKSLNASFQGKKTSPFKYVNKGVMATVGRNKAVVDLGSFRFGGFFAWVAWLFVHLMLLVDFRNRIIVFVNWMWSYINYDRGTRLIIRKVKKKE